MKYTTLAFQDADDAQKLTFQIDSSETQEKNAFFIVKASIIIGGATVTSLQSDVQIVYTCNQAGSYDFNGDMGDITDMAFSTTSNDRTFEWTIPISRPCLSILQLDPWPSASEQNGLIKITKGPIPADDGVSSFQD